MAECLQSEIKHLFGPASANNHMCAFRTNYTLSKDPDERMGIVDDAVSFVKGTMSKLKSDSGGFFTVSHTQPSCTSACLSIVILLGVLSIGSLYPVCAKFMKSHIIWEGMLIRAAC